MLTQQEIIIKDLAAKYRKDKRVIERIVYSPLKFFKQVATDDVNYRPVRVRYFGVFVQKNTNNKVGRENRHIKYIEDNIIDAAVVMATTLGFQIKDVASARRIITDAVETRDIEKLEMIYTALKAYKRNG